MTLLPCIATYALALSLIPFTTKLSHRLTSPIKEELGQSQQRKVGTPQFASIPIYVSFLVGLLMLQPENKDIYIVSSTCFFAIGLADDILKVQRKCSDGMTSLTKLFLQLVVALAVTILVQGRKPVFREFWVIPSYFITVLYVASFVNAVNITDGLDTLATKVSIPPLMLLSYLVGGVPSLMLSSLFAFLPYNSRPASTFMGDGGSHLIGAVISTAALLSGHPIVIAFSSIVFFVELLSSAIQIFSIRALKRKVFLIAPLHHDLEKRGFDETKITDTFFSLSVLFTLFSVFFLV